MKIYYPAGDRTPDLLNQTQTCYHLSQRGELDVSMQLTIKLISSKSGDIVPLTYGPTVLLLEIQASEISTVRSFCMPIDRPSHIGTSISINLSIDYGTVPMTQLATQINYRAAAVQVLKQVPSRFHIRDNVKIILLYVYYLTYICKTTLLP